MTRRVTALHLVTAIITFRRSTLTTVGWIVFQVIRSNSGSQLRTEPISRLLNRPKL